MSGFGFWFAMVVSAVGLSSANGGFPAGEGKDRGSEIASGASAAPADHGVYFAPAMRFDREAGSLEVTFGIEESARLSLYAFDSQGKLLAVLLDGNQAAGFHRLSLFSNRLQGYTGHAVFQLRAGQSVWAETRAR